MVLDDRRIKVREIAEVMNMSKERVCHILNQHLGMRKLSARWVPRLLTVDQKRVRMNISNALLAQFRRNKSEFWRRLITVDETWIHHYTPETFFVKWRGNHPREQLFCREKRLALFGRVTEMGASLGEVCRVTRSCWKIKKNSEKMSCIFVRSETFQTTPVSSLAIHRLRPSNSKSKVSVKFVLELVVRHEMCMFNMHVFVSPNLHVTLFVWFKYEP